jgi:hypothetical protein
VLAGRLAVGELRARSVAARAALSAAEAESGALLAALRTNAERVREDGAREYSAAFDDLVAWIDASTARFRASIAALAAPRSAAQTSAPPGATEAALQAWTAEEQPARRTQLQSLTTVVHSINAHMHRHDLPCFAPDAARTVGDVEARWEAMAGVASQLRALVTARQLAAERHAFAQRAIATKLGLVACWVEKLEGAALVPGEGGGGALLPMTPAASQPRANLDVLRSIAGEGIAADVDDAGSGAGSSAGSGALAHTDGGADDGAGDAVPTAERSALERATAAAALLESSIVRGALLGQQSATFAAMLAEVEAQQTELAERIALAHDAGAHAALAASTASSADLAARLAAAAASTAARAASRKAELQRVQIAVRRARAGADVAATLLHELNGAMLDARAPLAEATDKLAQQVRGAAERAPHSLFNAPPPPRHLFSPPLPLPPPPPPSSSGQCAQSRRAPYRNSRSVLLRSKRCSTP